MSDLADKKHARETRPRATRELVAALQGVVGVEVFLQEPMSRHTSYCLGGPADVLIQPRSLESLQHVVRILTELGEQPLVVGRGTNVVVRDKGIRGVVLKISEGLSGIEEDGTRLRVLAGTPLMQVCAYAACRGLAGLEMLAGVPGALGGAVAMNAGTSSGCIEALVVKVECLDHEGRWLELDRTAAGFETRNSRVRREGLIVGAVELELAQGKPLEIEAAMLEQLERRAAKQPLSRPSCGSVFKRPPGHYAGALVESAGCKGMRVGGVEVSRKHANFIVNLGNGEASDVLRLIDEVRHRVWEYAHVVLEPEVIVRGEL